MGGMIRKLSEVVESTKPRNPIFDDPEAMKAIRYLALKYPVETVMEWYRIMLRVEVPTE
jgi:hypothetical protein